MSGQIIDFVGPSKLYASIIASTSGAVAAFRGGTNTVINVWSAVDHWDYSPWSSTIAYGAGATVIYGQQHYISEVGGNLNNRPGKGSDFWFLAPVQPLFVSGLNTTDDAPTQSYIPFTFPTGALMQVRGFQGTLLDQAWITITSGVAFQAPNDQCLLGFSGCQPQFYTGTVG